MADQASSVFPDIVQWDGNGTSRIPFGVYTSEQLHKRELDRFFYQGHWSYVGLEAEIPNPGDFKRTVVGERSVIVVRDKDGSVKVVENICAHRGMQFCRERHGNRQEFICPYHQWSYTLAGELQGVPFRRGVRQDGKVNGGMPADFRLEQHGLTRLKVACRGGVVFASFDHRVESLEDYLGPVILRYFDRLFNGRKLRILGYNRQRIPGNWKLMQENIKDPYHPGLLHTWFVTFGLWRADNKSELKMDRHHRHAAMVSTRGQSGKADQVTQVSSFKESMQLHDDRFLDIVPEAWWGGPSAVMTTLFPSVILQQQVNSVSTRHIQPDGHGAFKGIDHYQPNALVTFNTHDLATYAGWRHFNDLKQKRALGFDPGETDDDRWRALGMLDQVLGAHGIRGNGFNAIAQFLARTKSRLMAIALEDLLGLKEQPNIPGTIDEHPNWRRRMPLCIDEIAGSIDEAGLKAATRERARGIGVNIGGV